MLIAANAGKRREAGPSSRGVAAPGVALSKKQKSKWKSKQVFEELLSAENPGWCRLSDCHNAALLFH